MLFWNLCYWWLTGYLNMFLELLFTVGVSGHDNYTIGTEES